MRNIILHCSEKKRSVHFPPLSPSFVAFTYHTLFLGQIHYQHRSYTGLVTLDYSYDLVLSGPVSHRQILLSWHLKKMCISNTYYHSKHNSQVEKKKNKKEKESRISKPRCSNSTLSKCEVKDTVFGDYLYSTFVMLASSVS